jgi:hypothetical protein
MLVREDLLGAVGDTSSWAEDTVGMVDKHADKGRASGTHTVVAGVDQRDSLSGHGARGEVGHRGRSWSKADSSYDTGHKVGILVP